MKLIKLKYKLPKEIIIPILIPSIEELKILFAIIFMGLLFNVGYETGKHGVVATVTKTQPVTVTVEKWITEEVKSPCAMDYGEEVVIQGCGWNYLGKAVGHSFHVLGREWADGDCGGKAYDEIIDKSSIKKKWLQDGYVRFMMYPPDSRDEVYENEDSW